MHRTIELIFVIIMFIILLIPYGYSIYNSSMPASKKHLHKYESFEMQVSYQVFNDALKKMDREKNFFTGEISDDFFVIRFVPPGAYLGYSRLFWRTIKGFVNDGKIYYRFTGFYTYRPKEFEHDRLLKKLMELAM